MQQLAASEMEKNGYFYLKKCLEEKPEIIDVSRTNFTELTRLWRESVEASHNFLTPDDIDQLEKEMAARYLPAVSNMWGVWTNGSIAAFLGCNRHEVEMLFVRPKYFGQGFGTRLLDHAAKLYGPLNITVNEQNEMALSFYRHRGFKVVGRSSMDSQGRPFPILFLSQKGA